MIHATLCLWWRGAFPFHDCGTFFHSPVCPPCLRLPSLSGWRRGWRGPGAPMAAPEGTPAGAALCWGSWSRGEGSGWAPRGPGPAGERSEPPPCATAAGEDAPSGSRCRSPGNVGDKRKASQDSGGCEGQLLGIWKAVNLIQRNYGPEPNSSWWWSFKSLILCSLLG